MRLYPTTNGSELRQLSRQLCIEVCPFYNGGTEQCKINQITISGARREFCRSDEYDGCPTYLGYLLRRSRSLRNDHDWLDSID